jgi:hypothetical protein
VRCAPAMGKLVKPGVYHLIYRDVNPETN